MESTNYILQNECSPGGLSQKGELFFSIVGSHHLSAEFTLGEDEQEPANTFIKVKGSIYLTQLSEGWESAIWWFPVLYERNVLI